MTRSEQDRARPDEVVCGLLRVALVAAVTHRPVLGLSGPVTKVGLAPGGLGPELAVETALSTIGLRRLVVRLLPAPLDRPAVELVAGPQDDPGSAALLVTPLSAPVPDTAPGLRDLTDAARLADTPDALAVVLRASNAGFRRSAQGGTHAVARQLLADLDEGDPTAARRLRLHAMLRRIHVPRPAEIARALEWPAPGVENQEEVARLYERALSGWPDPFTHLTLEPAPGRAARRVFAVPGLGGPAERGTRRRELAQAAGRFADTAGAARVALVAESGMGKSSFAARICRELAPQYQVVGWLTATDAATWESSRASLAAQLGLDDAAPDRLWAELAERAPALVVVDDAPGPEQFAVLPELPGLHWIVTSQSLRWRGAADVVELGPLPLSEATEYLLARTGARAEELVAAVAELFDGFPLALEQAAVAITEGVSMSGWLERHRADPSYSAAGLAGVWRLRLAQLADADPDAAALLRVLACAGSAPLPARLLAVLGDDFPERPTLPFAADLTRRDAAVATLRRQGLIRTGVDTETFQVHPLMARIVRDQPGMDVADTAMRVGGAASWLMEDYDPEDVSTWPIVASLVSAAVMACVLVFQALEDGYDGLPERAPRALADRALWPAAGHLADMGARRAAYRTRLLGLALYGDRAAAEAVRGWSGVVSGLFDDLDLDEVVPAADLGRVASPEARLLAARWINENALMLADRSLTVAVAYAERALELVPRSLPSAGTVGGLGEVPWTTEVRVEVLDNLGYLQLLQEEFARADRSLATALRLRRARPGAEGDHKYGELLNDRALILLERGLYLQCRADFARAAGVIRSTLGDDAAMLDNIENNLARCDHRLWRLRPAGERLRACLDRLWDRLDHQDTDVVIQQCNTGEVAYDLGETTRGLQLVEGAWRTLAERLGEDDRETRIRLSSLTRLRQFRGDLAAALAATNREIAAALGELGPRSPFLAVQRLAAAWLSGLAALTPASLDALTEDVVRAFGGVGVHAATAWDARAAHALAGGAGDRAGEAAARKAVALHRGCLGGDHPATLLAEARLALLGQDRAARPRPLASTGARRLLTAPDSTTGPGPEGFDADLARHGQAPLDPGRPGWEADRLVHLLDDGLVDLDAGERLVWAANAGRLAAVAGQGGTGRDRTGMLRAAAEGSDLLYGCFHPWTLLRRAADAVADDDRDELRDVLSAPYWP